MEWRFMPHGSCIAWDPLLVWLKVWADGIIALAYFTIPLGLAVMARQNRPMRQSRRVTLMWMFAAFVFGCGATHVMDVLTIWRPWYHLDTFMRVGVAVSSVAVSIVLWHYIGTGKEPDG